jgi:large repetitive protein
MAATLGNGLDQGQKASITALVTNDSKNEGVTWSVSGSNGSQGTLSGQTTTSVTYNAPSSVASAFTATVTATSIANSSKSATLQIMVNPLPAITTTSLPAATAGVAYSATLTESGGTAPFAWSVISGSLASLGLSLTSATGLISGTPTGPGSASFTFQVTDATHVSASSGSITITVNPPPTLVVTTTSLPGAALGVAYSQTLQATGGVQPYQWAVTSGSLPSGLTLSSAGVISGTPTGSTGTSNFTVTVTDSQTPTHKTSSKNLSITVSVAPLSIVTTSLAEGSVGTPYSQTLIANGGTPPYTWSVLLGALPTGLTLNSATGAITGTPSAMGTSHFTIQVKDSVGGAVSANFSIAINADLTITTASLPGGSVAKAYSATVTASGGVPPYTWSVTGNPSWLSIDPTTGVLSGTPTATGVFPFTVTVKDSESPVVSVSAGLSISIAAQNCTNDSTLTGNYAFVTSGWSSVSTATSVAGSFVADGLGNISSGLIDSVDQGALSARAVSGTLTGTYCVASDNLATINVTYSGALTGKNTLVAALDSADGNGQIISYDGSALKVAGLLRQQDTSAFLTSKITGNYAYGLIGADQFGNRFGMAGEFASDGKGNLGGEDDTNDGGALQSGLTFIASDFAIASTGRGTATIAFSTGNTSFVFYVVSSSEMLMMAFDTSTTPLTLAGQVLQQSGTLFTDASLDGTSVLELQSLGTTGNKPTASVGLFATTGNAATYTLSADQNQAGVMSTVSQSGTFLVTSHGRVQLTPSGGGTAPIFYLIGPNRAFAIGTGVGVDFGLLQPQTGSTFSDGSLSGIYLGGSQPGQSVNVGEEVDSFDSTGQGTLSGTSDTNSAGGPQTSAISDSYTVSLNGRAVVSQGGTPVLYLYLVSPLQFVALPVSSTQQPSDDPMLIDFHQ